MTDMITLTGLVATNPRHVVTAEGLPITSFRLASTQRRFDRAQERWVDGETNWFTITAFRQLAVNIAGSIKKGERVVVFGRLRIRDWDSGEKTGTNVEVDADAIGHDLSWGTASFMRSIASVVAQSGEAPTPPEDADGAGAGMAALNTPTSDGEPRWEAWATVATTEAEAEPAPPSPLGLAVDDVAAPF